MLNPIPITPTELVQWFLTIIALAGPLIPFVMGLTEAVKKALNGSLCARWYPMISLAWGLILGFIIAWVFAIDWRIGFLIGIAAGLSAAGLFNYGKSREDRG